MNSNSSRDLPKLQASALAAAGSTLFLHARKTFFFLASLVLLSFSNPLHAQVNIVGTTSGTSTGTSLTFSHDRGTDPNTLTLVAVQLARQTTLSSITYGGSNMTLVGQSSDGSGSGLRATVLIYRIINGPTGNQNIVINVSGSNRIVAGATSFSNVDTTTPLRAYTGTNGTSANNYFTATLSNVATGPGEIVFSAISYSDGKINPTYGSGQTQTWNLKTSTSDDDRAKGAATTKPIASGSTTSVSFANLSDSWWGAGAVSVRPIVCTTSLGGATSVCAGSTANVTPGTGGTWTSSNTAVATVTNGGVVTGVYPGSSILTFTDTATSCQYTRTITVNPRPVVGGGTLGTGTGTVNYRFYDGIPSGSTVDNIPTSGQLAAGTVTNFDVAALQNTVDPGDTETYSIRYTGFVRIDTSASYTFYTNSDNGSKLFINNQLVVNNDGDHGPQEASGTVSLTPGWHPIKVEFFNNGGPGALTVSYQSSLISKQSLPASILSTTAPTPSLSLCAGGTANVTPSTGGTWVSSNNSIATVTNAGVVSGVAAGSATLTFTNTTTGCTNTVSATVVAGPSLGGANSVCVGFSAGLAPDTGGTWSSSNSSIAFFVEGGQIYGVSPGTVTVTFTSSSTGCVSSKSFTVTAPPTLGGASVVCPGQTANVTPASGGTWTSSNNAIATVSDAGLVTGVSAGTVTLTFTSTATGCTNTRSFTVNAQVALGGASSNCVGTTALVTPNTGGTWASSNNAIATVTNAGVVTGVSGGSVTLSFTNSTTGCVSTKPFTVSVPFGGGGGSGIGGATAVCVGFQANVTPATGGVWSTSDSAIATVTNAGVVTGFSPGTVVLTFTETVSGCVSTVDFNVYPNVVAGGANSVCQGAIANVTPTTNGTWVSSDPAIAFVNNSGFVTGLQPGTVTLTFTSLGGCSTQKSFTVNPKPVALGAASVQVGQTAVVTPETGGTWISSNTAVATVTNAGVVTGVAEGAVTLTFTDSVTGCSGSKAIAVIDPGFYKNQSFTDSGDKVDPDPENNDEPEVVFPQSFTALVVTVFQDIDGDADGDQPVPNVTITVRDSEGDVVAVTTTGLDGSYTFDDLPPGFYTVTQTVPNGNFTLGDNPIAVSVVENTTVRADFVNSQLGKISGTILADANDEAIPDVLVSLLDENGDPVLDSNNQPITTTTNSAGFYLFDLIPPGTYQVQQTVPNGYTAVDDVDGADLTINGDVTPIVIAPGTVITGQDFVNFLPGSISGNISIDNDLNLAGDEPHIGVTVALLNSSGNPVLDGNSQPITTVTDADGNYKFEGLDPGDYRVAQTVPTGFTAISDSDGGNFTVVGDVTLLVVAAGTNQIANFLNQPQTDIGVTKIVSNSTPVVGTNVTFTVTVTNIGPQDATDVKVDDVALGMLYVSHVASDGTFAVDPGAPANTFSGLWTVGALNVGESATLTVVATVTPNAIVSTYNNSVNAYSELGDPNLTNNEDDVELDPVLGTISGTVSRDTTGDDLGDTPVQGVALALVDQNGNPVLDANNVPLTTVSNASGNYSFTGLPPGNYRVVETVPAGDVPVNDVDGGDLSINGDLTPIALAAGQTLANQNFVIAAVGSIAGTITNDTTGDNAGDSPLGGVVVILLQSNGSPVLDGNGDAITTITDGSGNYSFTDLTPGNYRVAHVPPGGMIAVDDFDGGMLTVNGDITPIAVLPGQDVTGQDFVDSTLGSISGAVLADADDDGDGDTGIAGVTVALVNASSVTIATTTTNSLGQYTFSNVPAGLYTVVETQPAGYTSVSDVDGGNLDINGDVTPITLLPGGTVTDQDFVEILNATITGIVQADTNNDNTGDAPLAGVTVTLLDENGDPVATTTTAANGTYSFFDLTPGDYTVVETDLSGYQSLTPNSVDVSLLPGGSEYVPFVDEQLGTISGIVDADTTGNGTGDTPLAGVTVTLLDENGDPVATTTTGVDGSYSFTNLPPGDFTVVETDPSGYVSLTPNSVPVTLTPGETEAVNFTDTQTGTISGIVDADTTGNGTGDTPLAGVTVTLLDENGDPVATTTTGVDGSYSFTNLPPGDFTVVETDLSGYVSLTPNSVDVTLTPGETEAVNFTDTQTGTISGIVDADTTGNGTGDTPLAGVTVTLLDENGDPVATTTTGVDGSYSFTNLPPGDYTVVETDPSGYVSLTPNSVDVTLTPGETEAVNFTDTQLGTISGFVLADTNADNTGDSALSGVLLTLKDASGNDIDSDPNTVGVQPTTATTAANGSYSFANLPAGNYQVVETQPQFYVSLSDVDGGNLDIIGDVTLIMVTAGNTVSNQNFIEEPVDLDTDDDTIPDTIEIANVCPSRGGDTDGDGVPDHLDLDSDGDGIFDIVEIGNADLDLNLDGRVDTTQGLNGLGDVVETSPDSGTINYTIPDSDGDGRPDYLDLDSDNDSISDIYESGSGMVMDTINRGLAQGLVNSDGIVSGAGAVLPVDTDGDLLPDYIDVDSNGDGVFDIVENGYGSLDPNLDGRIDNIASPADCDGIADVLDPQDNEYGWFPDMGCIAWDIDFPSDTDGDVFPREQEYVFGGDPQSGNHLVIGTTRRAGMTIQKNGTGGIDISYVRPAGRFDTEVTPYVSPDPRNAALWTPVNAVPTYTDNGDGTQTVKWENIHDIDGNVNVTRDRGFVRLFVATTCFPAGSYTLVQGWCRENVVGKRQTHGRNLVSMPVFTGYIDSVAGSTVTTTTSGKGANLSTLLTVAPSRYYLEVTDGPNQGHRFDLGSAGVNTFVLNLPSTNNTVNTLPVGMAGSHFVIRRHETLAEIYPTAEWDASDSVGSADQVLLYSGTGYSTYYNLQLVTRRWAAQGQGTTSQNNLIIAPGTGMMVVHASPADTNEILQIGDLRYNNFRRPLVRGTTGFNFTSLGFPFDASPSQLTMTVPNGFVSADSPGSASQILNWLGDTTPNSDGWTTNFLSNPFAPAVNGRWLLQGVLSNSTSLPLFEHCRSAQVLVQQDKLDWTHTRPWNPLPWVQPQHN